MTLDPTLHVIQTLSESVSPSVQTIVGYAGIPVMAAMVGTLIGSFYRLGPKGLSHLQHLAAGIIFSVVSVEILPDVIHRQHPTLLTIGFSAGVGFMLLLAHFSGHGDEAKGSGRKLKIPMALIAGVSVDVFLDGLILALTLHTLASAGRLLSLALSVELLSVGLTLTGTLRKLHHTRPFIFLLNFSVFSMLAFGTILGMVGLPYLPDSALDLVLSFGLAALLFLVTEELLVESHREVDTHISTVLFFAGFLVFLLLGQQHS
jgi:zinc transporter, ZIP family